MNFLLKIKNIFWPTKENHNQPLILTDRVIFALILLFLLVKVLFSFEILVLQRSLLFAELNSQKIIELTNQIRAQYGLPPVKENPLLDKAAQLKAYDMATNKYFSHFSPTGVSPWYWFQQAGYKYHYAGENLAMNFVDSEEVVKAWFNSPSHRANLLNQNYSDIGIAILPADPQINGLNKPIVVQLFGSPSTRLSSSNNLKLTKIETNSTSSSQQIVLGEEEQVSNKQITTTITINKNTTTTKIAGTSKQTTTTLLPTTTTLMPETTNLNQIANIDNQNNNNDSSTNIVSGEVKMPKEIKDTRSRINNINYLIASIIIILGTIVLIGTVLNYKNIGFNYGDIIVRIFIIIFIGASFLTFKLETFIGSLLIAS